MVSPPSKWDQTAITDGGIETDIIFNMGAELADFSAFPLLDNESGRQVLASYYRKYFPIAKTANRNFIFATPTWRANPDWGERLGYSRHKLRINNQKAVTLCSELAAELASHGISSSITGVLGPRRDAWKIDGVMTAVEVHDYHSFQIEAFADTEARSIQCLTLNNTAEAIGIARAAQSLAVPAVLSFTVEIDGRLPGGKPLGDAIHEVDDVTGGYADFYMVNCAHPTHFKEPLSNGADWIARIGGLRANASLKSHAELDESSEIDIGDIADFAQAHLELISSLPNLRVLGGCCGTDHRHIASLCEHCLK